MKSDVNRAKRDVMSARPRNASMLFLFSLVLFKGKFSQGQKRCAGKDDGTLRRDA